VELVSTLEPNGGQQEEGGNTIEDKPNGDKVVWFKAVEEY